MPPLLLSSAHDKDFRSLNSGSTGEIWPLEIIIMRRRRLQLPVVQSLDHPSHKSVSQPVSDFLFWLMLFLLLLLLLLLFRISIRIRNRAAAPSHHHSDPHRSHRQKAKGSSSKGQSEGKERPLSLLVYLYASLLAT